MKEKVIIATMLSFLIAIMWVGGNKEKSSPRAAVLSDVTAPAIPEESPDFILDEILTEQPQAETALAKLDYSALNTCALEIKATDGLSFGEAFGYYRYCLGQDSVFNWNGKVFTTALAGDVTIQLADSAKVKDPPEEDLGGTDSAAIH